MSNNTSIGTPPKSPEADTRAGQAGSDAEQDFAEAAQIDRTAQGDKSSTTLTTDGRNARPRLPHEHDESSDSQHQERRPIMERAHADIEEGRVDTDRGGPMNEAYKKQQSTVGPKYR